jgi:hypothetical protein
MMYAQVHTGLPWVYPALRAPGSVQLVSTARRDPLTQPIAGAPLVATVCL